MAGRAHADVTLDDIKRLRGLDSRLGGHPEYGHVAGVETTTGPLGQGLATAVGLALGERMLAARTGGLIDHHTYVIASDGDLMEGISQEAIALAARCEVEMPDGTVLKISHPRAGQFAAGDMVSCGWAPEDVHIL